MESQYWQIIKIAYEGFNERDIDKLFLVMDINVFWPKAFEGGYVKGHEAVRAYWTRQWTEINPKVEPISISELQDGRIEVLVYQVVKDMEEKILFDGQTKHIYSFNRNLIVQMDVEDT
jgi:nuclear transport factor 2 (NTF2) superfamily protein